MTHRISESASRPSGLCCAYHLGTVDYGDAYRLQKGLQQARSECRIGDTILLLDHPPVITLGRRGDNGNVLVPAAFLHEQGIEVFNTDRGGDVTFHNPGQIVAYFIVNIDSLGKTIHQYVHSLEEVVIQALADFQIEGGRDEKYPGVWVGDKNRPANRNKSRRRFPDDPKSSENPPVVQCRRSRRGRRKTPGNAAGPCDTPSELR